MSSKLLVHLAEVRTLPVITLGQLADTLKEDALLVVCLISILPFMQPIPIPGVSTVLGLVALMQGLSLMFIHKPLLTKKMRAVAISHEKFEIFYKAAEKFTKVADKLAVANHPVTNQKLVRFVCGFSIFLSAAFLSLPLPIPFSNFVPALSIGLICLGLLEEDIILVVMGLSITVAVFWMGALSYHILAEKFPIFFY
jgi:hypothetical protein